MKKIILIFSILLLIGVGCDSTQSNETAQDLPIPTDTATSLNQETDEVKKTSPAVKVETKKEEVAPNTKNDTNSYSNIKHGITFNYPTDWSITNERQANIDTDQTQLRLELKPNSNPNVSLSISTPPLETGFPGFSIESGFSTPISGLIEERSILMRHETDDRLIAQNVYYKDVDDFFTGIDFFYSSSNGSNFDEFLPVYYEILDSVMFN